MEGENKDGLTPEEIAAQQAAAEAGTPPAEVPGEEGQTPPAEVPVIRSREFIKEIYPDREFASDDDYDGAITEYMQGARAGNDAIAEVLFENPELAEILEDMRNGVPFRVAIARQFDPEDLVVGDDEPDAEAYRTAAGDRRKRREEMQARIAERDSNIEASEGEFAAFMEEAGLNEEDAQPFADWVRGTIDDLAMGLMPKPVLKKLYQAFKFDEAIQEALAEGEVNGRNETIEAKRVKKAESTDGLPAGGGAVVVGADLPEKDFFDEITDHSQKKQKWG